LTLQWTIPAKGQQTVDVPCVVYVHVEGRTGNLSIDFELSVRLLDNRRSEKSIRVRTNIIAI
jgi:hypothetical protein